MYQLDIIIPVYNCKAFLSSCVESLLRMQMPCCEILLIDDGSRDGSGRLCDELAKEYANIRVVHQENAGASAARNRGIREAKGEYLLFVDADDGVDPEMLKQAVEIAAREQPDMVLFGMTFDYYYHGKCYRREPLVYPAEGVLTEQEWGEQFAQMFLANAWSPIWNKIYKRQILLEQELRFREDMFLYEDLEFVLRYLAHCDRIWNIPSAIYHYRQSEDEGNARRRLERISSIADFLGPIEDAMADLGGANPCLYRETADRVLLYLYEMLVSGKISTCNMGEIKELCRDFARWYENLENKPRETSQLVDSMLACEAGILYFRDRKSALRHKIAVWVKGNLKK